jgi:hypothetical protein
MAPNPVWPNGKQFAFTIFDDTDYGTVENLKDIYLFLDDCGFRTTKSVWPVKGNQVPLCGGETCEDEHYLAWIRGLRARGFEIGYHMATYHTSRRHETENGLNRFRDLFGCDPTTMANHSGCTENIYWGSERLSGLHRLAYNVLTRFRYDRKYRGHLVGDDYFWGDLCRDRVRYVRNFVFNDINTLKPCPMMPYHDPDRPWVNYWFASSEGAHADAFIKMLSERNQDNLAAEGGLCIMYTHLACGFMDNGQVNTRFRTLMNRLSRMNGWFAPVGTILDFLREKNGDRVITRSERRQLERRWLLSKLRTGHS